MTPIRITYLNGPDIAALALTDDEILQAIESSLAMQGRGECVIEPRMHLAGRRASAHWRPKAWLAQYYSACKRGLEAKATLEGDRRHGG